MKRKEKSRAQRSKREDIMNVKRTKQENEQFSTQHVFSSKIPNPKALRSPDTNERKAIGNINIFYC